MTLSISNEKIVSEKADKDKPKNDEWITGRNPAEKTKLAEWLVTGCWSTNESPCPAPEEPKLAEYSGFDGWYNNIAHPELGAIGQSLNHTIDPDSMNK